LSREIEINGQGFVFHKMKNKLLVASQGLEQQGNTVTIATPERAFLDMIYFCGAMYFDNLRPLDREAIERILPVYDSKILTQRVTKILDNDRFK